MKDEGQKFEELLSQARACYEAEGETGDDAYWEIIWILAYRSDRQTLDQLFPLTRGDVFERCFSADVLGRLGVPKRFSSAEVINILLQMLEVESDDEVITSLVSSLGQHQEYDERIPLVLRRYLDHPDEEIRWCLAIGLGSYATPESAEMLITLSADKVAKVRDWATFGLGTQEELDSPEIRAALVARLEDEDADTRTEAIEGLALRKDPRVVSALMREFDASDEAELRDAEQNLPSERLFDALGEMLKDPAYRGDLSELQAAIATCGAFLERYEHGNED